MLKVDEFGIQTLEWFEIEAWEMRGIVKIVTFIYLSIVAMSCGALLVQKVMMGGGLFAALGVCI